MISVEIKILVNLFSWRHVDMSSVLLFNKDGFLALINKVFL